MLDERLKAELRRKFANHDYERSPGGVYVPGTHLMLGGVFANRVKHEGVWSEWDYSPNIIVNTGLDHFLDVTLSGLTPITSWYVAPFEGNYTPLSTDTSATIVTNATESTAYDEATREIWTEAGVASQAITNSASPADFTFNATKIIYGCFFISSSAKSSATGTLLAGSKFTASRSVVDNDVLSVTYAITAADA